MKNRSIPIKVYKIIIFSLFISCNNNVPLNEGWISKNNNIQKQNEVSIQILHKKPFMNELLSNGRLVAIQKNTLKFEVSSVLEKLNCKNGDYVRKGQILASLNDYNYSKELEKAVIQFKKAEFKFQDILVERGYNIDSLKNIPTNILEMANIQSGLGEAQYQVDVSSHNLKLVNLYALFDGKIGSIKHKVNEFINKGDELLTLIDDSKFEVEFSITEFEINKIEIGEKIEILTFSSENSYYGKITSLNPIVEKNGTILVKAEIFNNGELIEGMNVKVIIRKAIPDQFVIPKSAIV